MLKSFLSCGLVTLVDIYALCGIRTYDPSVQAGEDSYSNIKCFYCFA
jgi:hypothetical protein